MALRLQSGTELLTTYGIVMFLVALAIIIVVVLVSAPPSVIPKSCSIYGGLECIDIAYGPNTISGSILLLRASFAVPGVLNVSSYNAVIAGVKSTSGFCTTNGISNGITRVVSGGSILCVANFPTNSLHVPYSGTFNITANYCAGSTKSACPKSNGYVFAGTFTVEGTSAITGNYVNEIALNATTTSTSSVTTTVGSSTVYYVPITITNHQSSSTGSSFPEQLNFSASNYSAYEASNLGNIRFYQGSTELYSWCEATCQSGVDLYTVNSVTMVQGTNYNYTTLTISNHQSSATGSNFQQKITFPAKTFQIYESNNLGNTRFYLGKPSSANELYSWCESGCNSSDNAIMPNATFWVKLPSGISGNANVMVNMTFWTPLSGDYQYDGAYAGECPQCSLTGTQAITLLPTNTIPESATGAQTVSPSVYTNGGGPNSGFDNYGDSSYQVSTSDDGGAAMYVCAAALSDEDGYDWLSPNWNTDAQTNNPNVSIGNNNNDGWGQTCSVGYYLQDDGDDQIAISALGTTSAVYNPQGYSNPWVWSSTDYYPTFTASYNNELAIVAIGCSGAYCDNVTITNQSGSPNPDCIYQTGANGPSENNQGYSESTVMYACTGMKQGDSYQVALENLSGDDIGSDAVEFYEFPTFGVISASLAGGDSDYICAAAAGGSNPGLFNQSFGNDQGEGDTQIGQQGSQTCVTDFSGSGGAIVGMGVNGYEATSQNGGTQSASYSVGSANTLVIAALADPTTSSPSITAPSGCSLASQSHYDSNETAMIYVCKNEGTGSHTFSSSSSSTSIEVYTFNHTTVEPLSYAKYDNGGNVFNYYNNFFGTALGSSLSSAPGVTTAVSNGVSITDTGVNWIGVYTNSFTTTNTIAEAYGNNPTYAIGIDTNAGTDAEWGSGGSNFYWGGGGTCTTSPTVNLFHTGISYSQGTSYLISYAMITGGPKAYINYAPISLSAGSRSFPAGCIGLSGTDGTTAFYQWFRDRAYPPNGVMPSVTFTGTEGNVLYANLNSTMMWVKLPSSLAGSGASMTINMIFEPSNTNYDGVYAGEAPEQSSTYGQYDNGASLFTYYDNFKNTASLTGWNTARATAVAANGLTVTCTSGGGSYAPCGTAYGGQSFTEPYVEESYIQNPGSSSTGLGYGMISGSSTPSATSYQINPSTSLDRRDNCIGCGWYNGGPSPSMANLGTLGSYVAGFKVIQIAAISSTTFSQTIYSPSYGTFYGTMTYTNWNGDAGYISFGGGNPGDVANTDWVRIRALPPSDVMPPATFGSVS